MQCESRMASSGASAATPSKDNTNAVIRAASVGWDGGGGGGGTQQGANPSTINLSGPKALMGPKSFLSRLPNSRNCIPFCHHSQIFAMVVQCSILRQLNKDEFDKILRSNYYKLSDVNE